MVRKGYTKLPILSVFDLVGLFKSRALHACGPEDLEAGQMFRFNAENRAAPGVARVPRYREIYTF